MIVASGTKVTVIDKTGGDQRRKGLATGATNLGKSLVNGQVGKRLQYDEFRLSQAGFFHTLDEMLHGPFGVRDIPPDPAKRHAGLQFPQ